MDNLKPEGINDVLSYLVSEYNKGNLRDDNINEYVQKFNQILKENEDNKEFVQDTRRILNSAKDLDTSEEKK